MPRKKKSLRSNPVISFLWPIKKEETWKCLSLISLVFLISFNYTILKALKDPLIITAQNSSALVLAFLKTWAVLPAAFIGASTFTTLCNRIGFRKTFYIIISFFTLYFILFTTYLYPYRESLYLGSKDFLVVSAKSSGWISFESFTKTFLTLVYYWPLSSFYVIAELWSSIALSVLFWGFANQVTPLGEAKRFYGVINLLGNVSGFLAGMVSYYFNAYSADNLIFSSCCKWDHTLYGLMFLIIIACFLALIIFHYAFLKYAPLADNHKGLSKKDDGLKKRKKMGLGEAFSKCFQSKYILSIALLVLAYNLSMNILEILWKDQTKALYPKTSDYHNYMTQITMILGLFSTFFGMLISTFMRVFSWKKTAYFTPVILSVTSMLFFGTIFIHHMDYHFLTVGFGLTPLTLVVLIGGLQNSICRSAKFTFFDTTKEIAFIPLSKDDRIKAKAVIDGVGSRLGKSAGAVMVQVMVLFVPTVSAMAPYFFVILIPILSSWFWAIRHIGSVFGKYENRKTQNTA